MKTSQKKLIKWATDEIKDLENLIVEFSNHKNAHQKNLERFTSAEHKNEEAAAVSRHWRDYYEERINFCRKLLRKEQAELKKLEE